MTDNDTQDDGNTIYEAADLRENIDPRTVIEIIDDVEETALAEENPDASREQIIEETCQQIREYLRDAAGLSEPNDLTEFSEREAIDELGGGASMHGIEDDL